MRKTRFLLWLYVTIFISVIIIAASVLLFLNMTDTDTPPDYDGEPPTWGSCTTYIENENGSVRLTDTVGFAFDFEVELYHDFDKWGFEIPLYGEYENRLIIASTSDGSKYRPTIYVNGAKADALPAAKGRYKIQIDISHITATGFCAGNSLTVNGFGKIDLLCAY